MDKKLLNTIIALVVVIGFFAGAIGGGIASFILVRSIHRDYAIPSSFAPYYRVPSPSPAWYSSQPAASGSMEGQLRKQGKSWVRTNGTYTVGAYVADIYEGRLNQPQGRGTIGKVVALGSDPNGIPGARVDFGRGYVTGINLSELSLVQIQSPSH